MAKHGENIYKRKDGRYEGRYVIGKTAKGKTRFGYIYGHRYADVKMALLLKKAERAKAPTAANGCCQDTLEEWIAHWMEHELLGSVKVSTYQAYSHILQKYILPALGKIKLAFITPRIVYDFVKNLESTNLSNSTIKGVYRLLSAAMRCAFEEGLIQKNPCRRIKIQPAEQGEQRVLSRNEQELVKKSSLNANDLPMLLSLYTGMRLGEVCALKWSDIDWTKRTIGVRRTVQRVAQHKNGKKTFLMVGAPKSMRSCRVIRVPDFVLKQLKAILGMQMDNAYIFGHSSTAAEPRTIQRRCKRFMERLGIAGVHFHTLRHSFATRLLELGVDVKTVSVLLGHGSAKTTLDFYAHSLIEQQRTAVNLLAAC